MKETYSSWCVAPKNALALMEELDGPIFQLALVTVGSEELDEFCVRPNLKVKILPILQQVRNDGKMKAQSCTGFVVVKIVRYGL